MDKILVTTFGIGLIVFIYWFFLGKTKSESGEIKNGTTDILVEGGYHPEIINISAGQTTTLNFIRKDKNSCLEEIIIPDFGIKEYLPIDTKVAVQITPNHKGEYDMHCGMNMFHGKIIVK